MILCNKYSYFLPLLRFEFQKYRCWYWYESFNWCWYQYWYRYTYTNIRYIGIGLSLLTDCLQPDHKELVYGRELGLNCKPKDGFTKYQNRFKGPHSNRFCSLHTAPIWLCSAILRFFERRKDRRTYPPSPKLFFSV